MRYVIVGAGAIGGVVGARLAQHGGEHPPFLIARGEHGRAIASQGLRLRSPDDDQLVRVDVAADASGIRLRADDVLVFATKTQQIQAALEQWVDVPVFPVDDDGAPDPVGTAGELLPVFTALNGVESERIALRYFARVFGVCVWLPGVHLTPGEVVVRIAPTSGTFIVGRYAHPATAADRALLETLADDWRAATFRIHVVDEAMPWKYRKLLSNLANAVQALVGPSAPESAEISARLVAEAEDVYRAAGISWPTEHEEEAWRDGDFDLRPVAGLDADFGGSSWQSLQRGTGSIETDYLNGEIALLARTLGREAPQNALLQRLAREAAVAGAGTASMTGAELLAALDEVEAGQQRPAH